ncbi:hypothetical protein L4X63_01295 [Geomonas sp. Red32]|uniref:hypothetical protein n=1 Tax=Geomonas sp. Red32 TaxID=2912856 RepID=UPI00202CE012|nr:hypothetical protein [Geomonas sp. Red32]MCM0080216.1 hypothetical protein [Geomonas sp. Red32]
MATINDLVLAHIDNKPAFYARIEDISPDVKPGWWKVKLLVLTVPLQVYTWILDESQVNGAPFTMGNTPIMLEKVVPPEPPSPVAPVEKGGDAPKKGGKVVSLFDRKK